MHLLLRIDYKLVTILKLGGMVHYTIPSFPVFTTSLVKIKYQLVDDSTVVFELVRSYPALLKLYSGYTIY